MEKLSFHIVFDQEQFTEIDHSRRHMKNSVQNIYTKSYSAFGPQHWWPANGPFEVMVGAILTQNTNWSNVERAIKNLKAAKVLSASAIDAMSCKKLARLIRPAGYYNLKAKRLKSFVEFFVKKYGGRTSTMKKKTTLLLREELLKVHGIGPETADSILLYALRRPVFVIDAYTKRILSRHNIMDSSESYNSFQGLFHKALPRKVTVFNECHALLVKIGKEFCKPKPSCNNCPLFDGDSSSVHP